VSDIERVKRLVAYCKKLCGTTDPFEIADHLGVLYQIGNCEHDGCYIYLKKHRYIFLSNKLDETGLRLVMAHELGHALLDMKINSYFIRNKTLLLNSKLERRANLYAAHLLITDDLIQDFEDFSIEQFSDCTGYPEELIKLRLN
jgi:Zn-dependent peptidase ImmA (M78 family)